MKKTILLLFAGMIPSFSGFAFDGGEMSSFRYDGKDLLEARIVQVASDTVTVEGKGDKGWKERVAVPWDDALKITQLRMRLKDEVEKREVVEQKVENNVTLVDGRVAQVLPTGCVVRCIPRYRTNSSDSYSRVGLFVGENRAAPSIPLPRAKGYVFVKGLQGLADHEEVDIEAKKTEETIQIGGQTLRVYQPIQKSR